VLGLKSGRVNPLIGRLSQFRLKVELSQLEVEGQPSQHRSKVELNWPKSKVEMR